MLAGVGGKVATVASALGRWQRWQWAADSGAIAGAGGLRCIFTFYSIFFNAEVAENAEGRMGDRGRG